MNIQEQIKARKLDENSVEKEAIPQFKIWQKEARDAGVKLHEATSLSTITKEGKPSARMVLLKFVDEEGFIFFTNYDSPKAEMLANNPFAAMVFYWHELERQVRIEGKVEKAATELSDEYFNSRPEGNRITSIVSPQSEVIASRKFLDELYLNFKNRISDEKYVRPENWGGYRLFPDMIEFWQGRNNRLHDRIKYTKEGKSWKIERLAP